MRRTRSAVAAAALGAGVLAGLPAAGALTRAVDECKLLTNAQAKTIMGVKPFGGPTPDNGGCSWESDPSDRANLTYVTLKVEPASRVIARYDNDLRTFIDESTNVGIDELPGVGDEAFSTYSPLSGPGTADGIYVLVGKQVVQLGFQPVESVRNPSPEFDQVARIVKKVVAKTRG